ncbi:MAG: hydrogenase maturation protease [Deltaproteobacteria bacterium]|nr:MAG: hydrogenase maturation protease [Deltaproteobacteria bacterium]
MYGESYRTLVLGVGNILLSDEGFGVRAIEYLARTRVLPSDVQVLDGGTLGMDLLYYLEGVENLLLVDAVQANRPPGTLVRMSGDEVPSFLSLRVSPHQMGIPDMLAAARFAGCYPQNIVLWGAQPASLEVGLELSPLLASRLEEVCSHLLTELRAWGHEV